MSFGDFSRSRAADPLNSAGGMDTTSDKFSKLCDSLRNNIFAISGNISTVQRLTQQLGTEKDTQDLRDKLHSVQQNTQDMIKNVTTSLKTLNSLSQQLSPDDRLKQLEQQKLTRDYQVVLDRFQQVQRLSAEKSREYVSRAKAKTQLIDDDHEDDNAPLIQEESKRQQELIRLDNEIEYNETIILEREQSIREIEQAIHEVNEIFRDLGSLVSEQQGMIDNIESNIESAASRTGDANLELQSANTYQRKARNKLCYLLAIFAGVVAVLIVIIVLSRR